MLKNIFNNVDFFTVITLIVLVISSLLLVEFFKVKKHNIEDELLRKIPHIAIGVIFSLAPIFMSKNEIIISAIVLFFGIWIGKYSSLFKAIFSIKRITVGMWMTPLSLGILSWMWLPNNLTPFIVGMLILTFSDAFAAIFGKVFGKKKIPIFQKTFFGSLVFFITTFIILVLFSGFSGLILIKIFFISFILTILELILIFGLDNLFLPIAASVLFNMFL